MYIYLIAAICSSQFLGVDQLSAQDATKSIKIEVYRSCIGGLQRSNALQSMLPLSDNLEKEVGRPIEFSVGEKADQEELSKIGQKLVSGEIDFGLVWGTEFSWLKLHYPKLEPLAVVSFGGTQNNQYSRLVGRKKDNLNKEGYRGKRLAEFKSALLNDQIYRQSLDLDFHSMPTYKTVKDALLAVKNGKADCVIVDAFTYENFETAFSGVAKQLKEIDQSGVFPAAVLIGVRNDRMIWSRLEKSFLNIHNTTEGAELVRFWKFDQFAAATQEYNELISKMSNDKDVLEKMLNAGPLFQE